MSKEPGALQDYEEALRYAQKMSLTGWHLYQAALAMTYGQLGRDLEARSALANVLALEPDFAATARDTYERRFWRRTWSITYWTVFARPVSTSPTSRRRPTEAADFGFFRPHLAAVPTKIPKSQQILGDRLSSLWK